MPDPTTDPTTPTPDPTTPTPDAPRFPEVEVPLVGEDGNAYAILGRVAKALRRAGHGNQVDAYMAEATAGDYDALLATTMRWVQVA